MENRHNNDVSPLTANDAITDDVRSYLSTKSFYGRHKKNHPPLKPIDLNIHHEDKSAEVRAESVEGISLTALPHDIVSESADNTIIEESTLKLQISRGNELTEEDHNSEEHCFAVDKYEGYTALKAKRENVVNMIDAKHKKQVEENHHYLKSICEVLRLAAKQNLALRGHRERT